MRKSAGTEVIPDQRRRSTAARLAAKDESLASWYSVAMKRREAIAGMATAGLVLSAGPSLARRPEAPRVADTVKPKPLPFKPGALRGLSSKLVESHHEKNYSGAVRKLNQARAALAELPASAPGFVLGGLKEKELAFRNSVVLHELYFENLGGRGDPAGSLQKRIEAGFGSIAGFESVLARTALTKAGGSGWAFLSLNLVDDELELLTAGEHSQGPASSLPLLVLDMYEHSYAIDHGADAKKYVEAFYANINWQVVAGRLERAERASKAWNKV